MEELADDLGLWQQLGGFSLNGEISDWQFVSRTTATNTFRITWTANWSSWHDRTGWKSWIYMKHRYSATGSESRQIRIYPQEGKTIFDLPVSENIYYYQQEREIWIRQWINYKSKPWVNSGGNTPVIPLIFHLEGLLPLP